MGVRHRAALAGGLLVLGCLPGAAAAHHKQGHEEVVTVQGTTDPPNILDHYFDPDTPTVTVGATIEFKNAEPDGNGPPHTFTVLDDDCKPNDNGDAPCTFTSDFDSGWVDAGESQMVSLKGLPPGKYTFICRVNQTDGSETGVNPFAVFPPHARYEDGSWRGMVGELTVLPPGHRSG